MLELNGFWFYKAPGVKCVDMMSAFFKNRLDGAKDMDLKIFAPPASGENDPSQGEDCRPIIIQSLRHCCDPDPLCSNRKIRALRK